MRNAADASTPSVAGTVFDDADVEVTRSYAEALINAAQGEGQVEAVLDDLEAIEADVFRANPGLAQLVASPLIPPSDKDRILVEMFEGRAVPTVVRFLRVLNRHGRLPLIGPIARAARALDDRRRGRRPVSVRSAAPLDDAQLEALRDRLSRMLGASPILHLSIDPSLIGGLVVQVGDDVYDASIRNHLEQLRQRLIEGKTHEIQGRRDHFSHPA